ncbi:MAG TPA: serine/threonine-protein kinase [Ktedonobacterales bacterium]
MQIGPQRPESMIGQVIADYELTEYIGAGATGVVFRGRRKATAPNPVEKTGLEALDFPEEAAIKLLAPPLGATDAELAVFQQRFVREARTLKKLDHPNILRLIDYGQDAHSGYFYMVLRYMAGGSLASAIVNRGPLPLAEASSILAQIGGALDYAHGEGVVHRDVKPGNILLDADGTPYLSDFSIVRLLAETATLRTSTGHMMGTPAYMAPEQFGDSSRVGPAADIYGLGMVAYEMVTGHAAFGATNWAQVMLQQLQETPASPSEARPDLPKPAEAAIMQALAKDPAERFARAAAFANAFTQGLEGRWVEGLTRFVSSSARRTNGASSAQTIPERTTPEPPHRRSRMGVLGAAVALLLVVACMAALALPSARGALLAGLALGATATATSDQGGASSTQTTAPGATHAPGAKPTATPKKHSSGSSGNGGTSTSTSNSGGPTATFTPTFTPQPTATFTPTPTPTPIVYTGDIALYASLTSPHASVPRIVADGSLSQQWVCCHPVSVTLSWPGPQTIHRVVVWDRDQNSPDNNQINLLQIQFSNGQVINSIDMASGGPRCADVNFPAMTVTSVTVTGTDSSGTNGFKEIEVWATTGLQSSGNVCSNVKNY